MKRLVLSPARYKLLCYIVYVRDSWRCRICNQFKPLHAHHIVYRSRHGDDASYNLISLCTDCHDALHTHQKVLLCPDIEGQRIDADKVVKIVFLGGWTPGGLI